MKVFLLTYGEGCDGDENRVEAVFCTKEKAEARIKELGWEKEYRTRPECIRRIFVEEWEVE